MPTLSICIPTRNRARHLENCIHSLISAQMHSESSFQICISDNNSSDNTASIVQQAPTRLNIKYNKHSANVGFARNLLKVVSMADGEYVWVIGYDDLLMPYAVSMLNRLIDKHPLVDFFYINSYELNTNYLTQHPHPFDTSTFPKPMKKFSTWQAEGEMPFLDLINPDISFDFLGGIFLSVFRKQNWDQYINVLDSKAILDDRIQSHFDNTFPQIKIYAHAFRASTAYFNSTPLIVSLFGSATREWAPMYPLVRSVRLIQALREYRSNGLSFWKYYYCKNRALEHFLPDFARLLLDKEHSGYKYISPLRLLLENCLYLNFYFSVIKLILRKLRGKPPQN